MRKQYITAWNDDASKIKTVVSINGFILAYGYYMNEVGIKDFDYYDNLFSGVKIDFSKEKFLYTSSSYKKFSRDILEPLLILEEDAE